MDPADLQREQQIRQRLFDVLTEFPVLYQARQGVGSRILNPFTSLQQVVRTHVNPLILFINDIMQEIDKGLTYLEALERVVKFSVRYKYRDRILEAVKQLSEIEGAHPYFLWGLASMLDGPDPNVRAKRLEEFHRRLHMMNRRYVEKFKVEANVDVIPWRVSFREQKDGVTDGTYLYPTEEQLSVFRRALSALASLIHDHRLQRWFHRGTYKEILSRMEELAWLLFDYGYTVEEICGGVRRDIIPLAGFLNELLLARLETTAAPKMDHKGVSRHIILLTLLDYRDMVPFRTFYRRLSHTDELLQVAKNIEKEEKVKVSPLRRLVQLYLRYREMRPQLLALYLNYLFAKSHGDYLRAREADHFGVDLTRRFVLRYYDSKEVRERAKEDARRYYSSKASEEMLEVLELLIQALSRPESIRGKRVHILGHIQSGAMGRVLIGVHRGNIVALKEPKAPRDSSMPLSDRVRLLLYEARLHSHVQSGQTQHENIVECFGMVEEEDQRLLAIGYHPAETVSALVQRAKAFSSRAPSEGQSPLLFVDLRTVSVQLLRALLRLRERQVVHRDLKPGNLLYLVDMDGRISLIKLIDFGVALGLAPDHPKDLHERQVVGTLGYMAPELVFREASYPSDLYSAGVIIYQLMSGRLPLEFKKAKSTEEIKLQLKRVVQAKRAPLLSANPNLAQVQGGAALAELVDRLVLLDPTRRPPLEDFYRDWMDAWKEVPEEALFRPVIYSS
ncbi:MAG: protein kinase domain-containing protein [Thermodesulfobacteriota bacterium]